MKLPIYQVDAFADKPFEGNPAAVIPLEEWLPDDVMQAIAEENNLAETAFFVPSNGGFHIRWFTPNKEVKLCGHATLASAYVLFGSLGYTRSSVTFESLSGALSVAKTDGLLTLDFPNQKPERCDIPDELVKGLGKKPVACYRGEDFVAVYGSQQEVSEIQPDNQFLKQLDLRGVIVTARSCEPGIDFVARMFAPKYGIPEDSVTGSAYTQLAPYWAEKIQKTQLNAKQISPRGGRLTCELKNGRVYISGSAIQYMEGTIAIPD